MKTETLRNQLAEATPGPWTKTTFGTRSTAAAAGAMASCAYATARHAGVPMTDLTVIDGPEGRAVVGFTGNGPHSPENAALIVAAVNALPTLLAMAEAARDLYSLAVGEHGHDETHSADWPSCLPAHIAMNRYRDALGRLDALP